MGAGMLRGVPGGVPLLRGEPALGRAGLGGLPTRPPSPSTHDHFPAGGVVVVAGFFAAGLAAAFGAAFAGVAA